MAFFIGHIPKSNKTKRQWRCILNVHTNSVCYGWLRSLTEQPPLLAIYVCYMKISLSLTLSFYLSCMQSFFMNWKKKLTHSLTHARISIRKKIQPAISLQNECNNKESAQNHIRSHHWRTLTIKPYITDHRWINFIRFVLFITIGHLLICIAYHASGLCVPKRCGKCHCCLSMSNEHRCVLYWNRTKILNNKQTKQIHSHIQRRDRVYQRSLQFQF